MPYEVRKDGDETYVVVNKDTGETKARHLPPDAKQKAEDQVRLLHGLEHGMTQKEG